eukprot:TRINITY_DN35510_c0_g1_i1.p1 TRINITY_DN35510_c0_g1~~TRINITY_DN35510_c0_g1_i1.p1  ORF type:complete len:361 (-),score=96.96 TRINITY_DN35510_c0_g1_i1:178-1146(-)
MAAAAAAAAAGFPPPYPSDPSGIMGHGYPGLYGAPSPWPPWPPQGHGGFPGVSPLSHPFGGAHPGMFPYPPYGNVDPMAAAAAAAAAASGPEGFPPQAAFGHKGGYNQRGKGEKGEKGNRKGGGKGQDAQPLAAGMQHRKGGNSNAKGADAGAAPNEKAAASDAPPEPPVNGSTVMLRNIPNRYTQDLLLQLLDEKGFKNKYDFVYLPMDFRNGVNLGYAFVNTLTHQEALKAIEVFHGYGGWLFDSQKVCEVSWAHPHQGYDEHVERYRNSPVMHPATPEEYKPMVFKNGVRIPFPPPTKAIRAPKLKLAAPAEGGGGAAA